MNIVSEKFYHQLVLCRRVENEPYLAVFFWKTLHSYFENSQAALLLMPKIKQITQGKKNNVKI